MSIAQVVADLPFSLQVLQPGGQSQVLLVVWQGLSIFTSPAVEVSQVCCKREHKKGILKCFNRSKSLLFCPQFISLFCLACLVLLLHSECPGALVRWSGGAGSAAELGREHPVLGRPRPGYHVWRPGTDDHSPGTQRHFTLLFSISTSTCCL